LYGTERFSGAQILLANIQDTKSRLSSMNLSKKLMVGNSDAGSYFNTKVLSAVDYGVRIFDGPATSD
jgi:hypothetical protein